MTNLRELEAVREIQRQNMIAAERLSQLRRKILKSRPVVPTLSVVDTTQIASKIAQTVRVPLMRMDRHWIGLANRVGEITKRHNRELLATLASILPSLSANQQQAIIGLAEHGWFMDPEMTIRLPGHLADALGGQDHADTLTFLEDFFVRRTSAIEESLKENYPDREAILGDAFEAHRLGKYNLSVPVFLTQADGIFGSQLFGKRGRTAENHRKASGKFLQAFFELFEERIPLWESGKKMQRNPVNCLNRHQVLHGESTQFGTQSFSLQCISLLSFLNWLLNP